MPANSESGHRANRQEGLGAVVLAGGESSRMGSPKALLPDQEGRAFVVRILQSLSLAGIGSAVVVTGRHHDLIADAVALDPSVASTRIVRNPDPARGQISSLWVGMDATIRPETEGLLMTVVDVPMVTVATIEAVIDAWRRTRAPIVRPAIGAQHGHPVIFDHTVFDELRRAPAEAGAKTVILHHAADILNVPVDDRGCLVDIDTPADYDRIRRS